MGNEIENAKRAAKALGMRLAKERANRDRAIDRRPRGFWTQVVYDYIVKHPGSTRAQASRSVEPHRSSGLGSTIISYLLRAGWITQDQEKRLSVPENRQQSKLPWAQSWDDPL